MTKGKQLKDLVTGDKIWVTFALSKRKAKVTKNSPDLKTIELHIYYFGFIPLFTEVKQYDNYSFENYNFWNL